METILRDSMHIEEVQQARTADEARQYAIAWQTWVSDQDLSYNELAEWQTVFTSLADKFGLSEEFKENAII